MKREIKFRAWHIGEKKICNVKIITFSEGAFLIGIEKQPDYIQGNYFIQTPTEGRFCYNNEFELLQFTGLKDKNGKEIYEGDIVKIWGSISEDDPACGFYEPEYKVIFKDGMFVFDGDIEFIHLLNKQAEVIGNIYENPELL